MDQEDFVTKLMEIEEQANLAATDSPAGFIKSRCHHIALLARVLRGRLEAGGVIITRLGGPGKDGKLLA
jgi:hypothetical protein